MNAAISNYDEQDFNYRSRDASNKVSGPSHARRSRNTSRRRGKAPEQFNGIHRRRTKKISW
ncbi:MAG: hypothetical protein KDA92_01965 [Planctomycetales bacterium]|nr:hypothetical protein [Planctomycetales bacterium]MCA9168868.1 hypothetical protein [Planctomycetales bacterium]